VFFILPVAVLGLLALTLFFDFLGTQATEIAKLISEIEIQCEADFWNSFGSMAALDPGGTGNVTCAAYLPKIAFFFILIALWCVIANVITLKLFEGIKPRWARFLIAAGVTAMLPGILLYKYLSVIPIGGGASGIPGFAALIVLETLAFIALFAWRFFSDPDYSVRPLTVMLTFAGSILLFLTLSLLFAFYPANLFNSIGSINTIVLYVVLAYAFLGGLFYYGRATGIPFAAILLVWVIAINALGLNSTHTVEARDVAASQQTGNEQFLQWFQARRDRAAYTTQDYPVYIVASAGGGIYAAMRSAYFLDFLQQKCPAFAHHIFGVSGVSGGGLGALAFAAQQQSLEQPDLSACNLNDNSETLASYNSTPILDNFFSKDVISTIVGAGLFPDMLQRIIPWPIMELNRSHAFRKALGENWRDALGTTAEETPALLRKTATPAGACSTQDYFSNCEINSYWDPAGDVPMLIFNATEVDTGSPVILSNLDAQYYANSLAARNSPNFANRSIYLVDGASLSARFPIALPAGFLSGFGASSAIRLVDGGYFDGSGLSTAQAMKLALEDLISAQNLRARVRIIFLGEKVPSIYDLMAMRQQDGITAMPASESGPRGAELAAHAKALFQARDQRSAETLRQTFRIDPTLLRFQWDPAITDEAATPCSTIPLAWYLAPCTQRVLKERLKNAVLESTDYLDILRQELSPQ
jgi:hypothetical protein